MRRYMKHLNNSPCLHIAASVLAKLCLSTLSFHCGQQYQTPSGRDQVHQPYCYFSPGDKKRIHGTTGHVSGGHEKAFHFKGFVLKKSDFSNFCSSWSFCLSLHTLQCFWRAVRSDKHRLFSWKRHVPAC